MTTPAMENPESKPELEIVHFKTRGLELDTCLKVFDTEFHVSSVIFRAHSAFFHTFLDSADKQTKPPKLEHDWTKYEWVSEVEKGGSSWTLIDSHFTTESPEQFNGNKEDKTEVFRMLLCAIWGHPYGFRDMEELQVLVEMAEYYCALLAVSRSFASAFIGSLTIFGPNKDEVCEALIIACKLRLPRLFADCVIYVAGEWPRDGSFDKEGLSRLSADIRAIITKARETILEKMGAAQQSAIRQAANRKINYDAIALEEASLPQWYRLLYQTAEEEGDIHRDLEEVLEDNLVLLNAKWPYYEISKGDFEEHFLCAEISEENFPWDTEELDW